MYVLLSLPAGAARILVAYELAERSTAQMGTWPSTQQRAAVLIIDRFPLFCVQTLDQAATRPPPAAKETVPSRAQPVLSLCSPPAAPLCSQHL